MKETKLCPICKEFFFDAHGNSVYCPGKICEKKARKIRNKKRYAATNLKADHLWLNEKILRETFHRIGSDTEIDQSELDDAGFDLELFSEQKKHEEVTVFYMRHFGFSLLKNKKIIVWKLL